MFLLRPAYCATDLLELRSTFRKIGTTVVYRNVKRLFSSTRLAKEPVLNAYNELFLNTPKDVQSKLTNLSFENCQMAFSDLSSLELLKHVSLLSLLRIRPVSENAAVLLNISKRILGKSLTNFVVDRTLFQHFCGGKDLQGLIATSRILAKRHLGSIVDYAAECEDTSNNGPSTEWLNSNLKLLKDAILSAAQLKVDNSPNSFSFVAVKITSVCNPALLHKITTYLNFFHYLFSYAARVSSTFNEFILPTPTNHEILMKKSITKENAMEALKIVYPTLRENDLDKMVTEMLKLPGSIKGDDDKISYFQWTSYFSPECIHSINIAPTIPENSKGTEALTMAFLTEKDIKEWKDVKHRIDDFSNLASQHKIRLLIDAEQTFFQSAIDYVTALAMEKYNRIGSQNDAHATQVPAIIYNTYQLYLKNSKGRLECDAMRADMLGYKFATKLVRGAYMLQEDRVAHEKSYPTPVHQCIEDTHACYNGAVEFMMSRVPKSELLCGTHNEESVRRAAKLLAMNSPGSDPQALPVSFAQLLGMCDHISLQLGRVGLRTFKYVPYGALDLVIPYLIRRAEENGSVLSSSTKECKLMWLELRRRLADSFFDVKHPSSSAVQA